MEIDLGYDAVPLQTESLKAKARSPSVYSKKVLTSTMVKPEEESFASASGNEVDNFFTESLLMEEFKTTNIRQVSGVFLVL